MAISISGTVYTDRGVTPMGSGRTLNVSVNGAASAASTTTASDGTYTLAGITAASGAVLTIYLQGNTEVGCVVTKSTGSNLTGVDVYQDHLIMRSDNGVALSLANLVTGKTNAATGISSIYSALTSQSFTVVAGKSLFLPLGHSFSPGTMLSNSSVGKDCILQGSFTFSNVRTLTVAGDFINTGTLNWAGGRLTLTGTGSQTLSMGTSAYPAILTINGSGGTYIVQEAINNASMAMTVTAGTFDANGFAHTFGNFTVNGGTYLARNGVLVAGNMTVSSTGVFTGGSGSITFTNVSFSNTSTFTSTSGTLTLTGVSGTVVQQVNTTATFAHNNGTVVLSGTSQGITSAINGTLTFYNLSKTVAAADTLTFSTAGTGLIIVANSLTLHGASGQLLTLTGSGTTTWDISVPATQTLSYLNVVKSNNSGTTAAAGSTSTDGGGNTGWTFGASGRSGFLSAWAAQSNCLLG